MSSVLIVRPSSLGDIVHALPVVSDIRQHRPAMSIDWVAEEMFVELVTLNRDVRTVIPVALRRWRHAAFARATWREISAFRAALKSQRYDAVIDLQEQVKSAWIGLMARGAVHGPDRSGIHEPAATLAYRHKHRIPARQHLTDRCRELAGKALGYAPVGPPRFGLAVNRGRVPDDVPAPPYMVFIHSTSNHDKLWPESHWRSLLARFASSDMMVVLPSGNAAEAARGERLSEGIPGVRVAPRKGFADTASLLAHAELVCGVDTGLIHLAAALGVPTIALFMASDPEMCGAARLGANARDLGERGRMPSLEEVIAAVAGARGASS